MNAIEYALSYIKRVIPRPILDKAFMPTYQQDGLRRNPFIPSNIDNEIKEKVINGIVRRDCDIAGSTEVTIPLNGISFEPVETGLYIIRIPRDRLGGREITSALGLIFYGMNQVGSHPAFFGGMNGQLAQYNGSCNNGTKNSLMKSMVANTQSMMYTETTNVRVLDGNTVIVNDLLYPNQNSYLKCILSHDSEFSSIARPAWVHFARLCELACKTYIYNKMVIDIDMAQLVGGHELGIFKDIIDGYSEANQLYQEYYDEKWRRVQFMSDEVRHARYLKSLIGRFK